MADLFYVCVSNCCSFGLCLFMGLRYFKAASNGLKEFWKELKYQTDREHIGYFRWLVKFKNKYKEEWKKAFVSLQIFNDIFTFYLQKNPIRHGSSCWIQTIQFLVFNRAAIYQRDNER